MRHTLNLINNDYKNILVRSIDTDVLVLLISYTGQVELNDIEIHAYLINSDRYYNIKQIIRELTSDIFLTLPFFYAFTGCDTVSSFYGKGMCKAYDVWVKVKGKLISLMFSSSLGKSLPIGMTHIGMLGSFVLQLYGSRHDTLGAAQLDKFKKSTDGRLVSLQSRLRLS